MSITGRADGPPQKVGVALVDVLTGKDAVIGILAALAARNRTGRGQRVEVDLLSSLLGSLANQSAGYLTTGRSPGRMGNQHPSIAPYELLQCADGYLAVACGNDAQFRRLVTALGLPALASRPEYATNADRVANRESLAADLESRLVERPAGYWEDILSAAGIAVGPVSDIAGAFRRAASLGLEPSYEVGPGRAAQVRNPIRLSEHTPTGVCRPRPRRARRPRTGLARRTRRPSDAPQPVKEPPMSTQSLQVTTGVELAGIDDLLTVDERLVRSSVRALCEEHVDPFVADWFERGEIDDIRGLTKALGTLACSGCTWTATAARGCPRCPMASRAWSWRPPTRGSARWSPSRGPWRCSPSGAGAPRSRSGSGCPRWRPARRSVASG